VLALIPQPGSETPLGWSYYVLDLSRLVLGIDAYQTNYIDQLGAGFRFDGDGFNPLNNYRAFPFSQVVAFEISSDGAVRLLEQLPPDLSADDYNPHARILLTTPEPLPYFD
jgi:hypothetical protein